MLQRTLSRDIRECAASLIVGTIRELPKLGSLVGADDGLLVRRRQEDIGEACARVKSSKTRVHHHLGSEILGRANGQDVGAAT